MKKYPLFKIWRSWKCSIAFLGWMLLTVVALAQVGSWSPGPSLPAPRIYGAATEFNGKIYYFGGTAFPPETSDSTVFVFDTLTMTWELGGYMPKGIDGLSAVVLGDKIYIVGGGPTVFGVPSGEIYEFDPVQWLWQKKADMLTPRSFCATSVLDGKIYTVGGLIGYSSINVVADDAVEVFDPATNEWTAKNPFPQATIDAAAASVAGEIYVIGGSLGYPYTGLNSTRKYDAVNDTWALLDPMPTGRWGTQAAVLNDRIYIIGGNSGLSLNYAVNEFFDPESGWNADAPMPGARRSLSTAVLGQKIYAMGGLGDAVLDRVEVFSPSISDVSVSPLDAESLLIFPNPASDQLHIVNRSTSDGCLTLLQADGRVVASLHLQGYSQQQVSVADVPPGLLQWYWMPGCNGAGQSGRVVVVK